MATSTAPLELWDPTTFDALRRQLIPSFDLLYASAGSLVAMCTPTNPSILGAGTGLLSAAVLERNPDADLLLVDRSEAMLLPAKQRFAHLTNVRLQLGDLLDPLPEGRFHAVVSALAIHHLSHPEKRNLFARIREALLPGGVFVNVEQVLAPTPELEKLYEMRHEAHARDSHAPAAEWAAGRERMKFDIPIDVETQLGWLRDAGFAVADCVAKDWRYATYAGWVEG
jgi:tRNA (cmo5U34)-methyltransferase